MFEQQIPIDKTILVVGNGPVRKKLGEKIDSFDVVVRFNRYILSEETGYRPPDIHFSNNQIGHVSGYREGILTIGMECQKISDNYDRYHNVAEMIGHCSRVYYVHREDPRDAYLSLLVPKGRGSCVHLSTPVNVNAALCE